MHLQETEVATAGGRVRPWAQHRETMTMTERLLGNSRALALQDLSGDPAHLLLLLLPKELALSGTAGETREGADGVPEVPVGVALSSQKVPEPPS